MLDTNARKHRGRRGCVSRAPLSARLFDSAGNRMSPSFSYGASGKLYRYYVSAPLQQGRRSAAQDDEIRRVPVAALEKLLITIIERIIPNPRTEPLSLLKRVEIHGRCGC